MLAKSLITMVVSLALPLLVVCAPPYDNCINTGTRECLSRFSNIGDAEGRAFEMTRCFNNLIQPGGLCFPLP
ncbi:hypothetical protein BDF21DRAFT_429730 [Thamnidium elegans]|nr:hypothetical protein BDF21DRAFT_429730 [Thamnidium elegans]